MSSIQVVDQATGQPRAASKSSPAIRFVSLPTDQARHYWSGGADAYGAEPEVHVSDGEGLPCRHCQQDIAAGENYLILAHKPFPEDQPYAETGPIFLHAKACSQHPESAQIPEMFLRRESYLIKGYGADDRIVYGTGQIVPSERLDQAAAEIFSAEKVAYIHVRSALNNCYTCRIDRAE
ncbi:DUF1203 domain-containing protein [Rhodovibrionaceae bacterium A322]